MFFGELACLGVWIDLYIAGSIWILERSSSFDEETNRVWFWIWSYQDFFSLLMPQNKGGGEAR